MGGGYFGGGGGGADTENIGGGGGGGSDFCTDISTVSDCSISANTRGIASVTLTSL